jgi:hypothetical protein
MVLDIRQMKEGKMSDEQLANLVRSEKSFILYHGTTDLFLPKILEKGILPRSITGNSVYEGRFLGEEKLESQSAIAYLGSLRKAFSGAIEAVCKYDGKMTVLRCLVNSRNLFPDEDCATKKGLESLAIGGSCGVKKVIPSNILGYLAEIEQNSEEWVYTPLKASPAINLIIGDAEFRNFYAAKVKFT